MKLIIVDMPIFKLNFFYKSFLREIILLEIQSGHKDIAANCLQIYFDLSPPTNQFYIRAHLCEALVYAPTNIADQVRFIIIY